MPTKTATAADTAVEDLLSATDAAPLTKVEFAPPPENGAVELPPIFRLADMLWSGARAFIPRSFQSPAEVAAAILTGRELGIGAMTSLRVLHPVNGRIEMSAELMLALANKQGVKHKWIKTDEAAATIRLTRDGFEPFEFTFTVEDAKRAKLYPGKSKSAWSKYLRTMLRWRCVSAAISAYCPEVLLGVYHEGELSDVPVVPASWASSRGRGDVVDAEYEEADDEDEVGKKNTDDDDEL